LLRLDGSGREGLRLVCRAILVDRVLSGLRSSARAEARGSLPRIEFSETNTMAGRLLSL
jgi:hypothetical protein